MNADVACIHLQHQHNNKQLNIKKKWNGLNVKYNTTKH